MILNSTVVVIGVQVLFIDASSRCGKCGYDCQTFNRCSIAYQSYCNCAWCEITGCRLSIPGTINHYAMGMYQPTTVLGGVEKLAAVRIVFEFCCNASLWLHKIVVLSAPISGFVAGDSDDDKSTFIAFYQTL